MTDLMREAVGEAPSDRAISLLLHRDALHHRPSVENRVAFQDHRPPDTLGARSGRQRDDVVLGWSEAALRGGAAPRRHLDVGCGFGNHVFMLHSRIEDLGDVEHVGIDLNHDSIAWANAFATHVSGYGNCSFQYCDVEHALPFPDGWFTVVTMSDVIEHLEQPAAVLAELQRVLAPGGRLIVTTPRKDSLFKRISDVANRISRGRLSSAYYGGKDTELDEDGKPIMQVSVGHDHISEMNPADLDAIASRVGFEPVRIRHHSVMSGSAWFDRHKVLLLGLLAIEFAHDRLQRPSWAHSFTAEYRR